MFKGGEGEKNKETSEHLLLYGRKRLKNSPQWSLVAAHLPFPTVMISRNMAPSFLIFQGLSHVFLPPCYSQRLSMVVFILLSL